MRRLLPVAAVVLALAGCGGGAQELLDTANLEVLQNNREHARALYRKVIEKYPGTADARTAEDRLRELD